MVDIPDMSRHPLYRTGFTLSELLIALTILGVIATFTIPKVLSSQQNSQFNAVGKEVISMISGSLSAYGLQGAVSSATGPADLTPFMNYVAVDTSKTIDSLPGLGSVSCASANRHCLLLHNGAVLRITEFNHFCSINNNQYIFFILDADGKYSGSTSGPGKALQINVFSNGRISVSPEVAGGEDTCLSSVPQGWGPDPYPDWFSWN